MKKDQKQRNYNSNQSVNNNSSLRILKRFNRVISFFNFDVFQYLKAENEKLQIIYANIRV
jgi:bisphosphoglycerate-dependent phosphoglycerate mutase